MPTTTNYIWDEQNYLAESDDTNTINVVYTNEPRQYGNLLSTRILNTTFYHHFDAIGSTRQLTNAAGRVTDTIIYDAWGNVTNRSGATMAFLQWIGQLGYRFDCETAKYYVRARTYCPSIGRWNSRDMMLGPWARPYCYLNNRLAMSTDPSGNDDDPDAPDPSTIRLVPGRKSVNLDNLSCGDTALMRWNLFLNEKAKQDGYIVQEISYFCEIHYCFNNCQCSNLSAFSATARYWEAWFVEKDTTFPETSITDTSSKTILENTCGDCTVLGTFKFCLLTGICG